MKLSSLPTEKKCINVIRKIEGDRSVSLPFPGLTQVHWVRISFWSSYSRHFHINSAAISSVGEKINFAHFTLFYIYRCTLGQMQDSLCRHGLIKFRTIKRKIHKTESVHKPYALQSAIAKSWDSALLEHSLSAMKSKMRGCVK